MDIINNLMLNSWIFFPMLVWVGVWKGLALWYAARRGQKVWYVVLLIINTLGILEIIYIFAVAKKANSPAPAPVQPEKN
jgi:hypothetical protein